MGLLGNIKEALGRQNLKSKMLGRKRERTVVSLNDASTVGIVFDPTDPEVYELVKKYVNYLKEMKKKVKAVGFYDQKDVPASTYSKLEFDYISQKDLAWNKTPSGVIIDNFVNEEYDILIDLNVNDQFPLHYIATLSKAKFKVGKNSGKGTDIYDMVIETGKDKGVKFLLRNLDTYLLMLNKKE
jgi:hypothetical protein